jgi:hypothetical protein
MKFLQGVPKSRIILIAIVFILAVIVILSDRPWGLASTPRIAQIAEVPDTERLAPVHRYARTGTAGILPYTDRERRPEPAAARPLKLGWSYREQSIFTMPLWATSEMGLVLYVETPEGREFAILAPGQIPLLDEAMGSTVASDYRFRWYLHIWGWWILIALIVWTVARRREDLARERAHWEE